MHRRGRNPQQSCATVFRAPLAKRQGDRTWPRSTPPRRSPITRPPLRTSTRWGRSRRSGMCPRRCTPGAIRRERHGEPNTAMQLEVVETPKLDSNEVLIFVMAAGVNYNGVWAALGTPISPFDVHKAGLPRRRVRRLGHRLGGRRQGEALESRRPGRGALQPGRRRRRGVQRRRPDVLAHPADLGLRDARRLLRPVRPRSVAAADAAPPAPDLGGIGLLHPDPRHRLPDAVRPSARTSSSPATTCWSGAPRAAWGPTRSS